MSDSIKYKNVKVGIHQPNFFPWLGYFNKVIKSDIFIILDDVQYPKKNAKWLNRVYLLINNDVKWFNANINNKYSGYKNINEIQLDNQNNWKKKAIKQVYFSYIKHSYFKEIMPWFESIINKPFELLIDMNMEILVSLLSEFDIDQNKLIFSSKFNVKDTKNQKLIKLIKAVKGTTYIAGGGAEDYQNDNLFNQNNINVQYQNYNHPNYNQYNRSDFVSGLSILDVLMNLGFEGTKKLIHSNAQI